MNSDKNGSVIREAVSEDAALLADIIRNANRDVARRFHLTEENAPKHPSNCREEWILFSMEKGARYCILEFNAIPCGCAALEMAGTEKCYLERLAVLPEFRHRGLGRMLVNHMLRRAEASGCRIVEIGIIDSHEELKNWYLEQGFELKNTAEFPHLPFRVAFMKKYL